MSPLARALLCAASLLPIAACAPADRAERYQLTGQVLEVRTDRSTITIKHQDIVGFMPGMTMPFPVKDTSLLAKAAAGDLVDATLVVDRDSAWIERVEKTGHAPLSEPAPYMPAAGVSIVQPGDAPPDTALTDQQAQTVRLGDWRGRAVAVTFIYTRCPLPQYCPLLDRRFAEVQRAVRDSADLADRVHLLSVSFDPDADTPAALTAHASRLQADPALWTFATAPREAVDRFAAQFGVNVIREGDGTITHNMRTAVIGADGRVRRVWDGSEWTAADVVDELRRGSAAR